MLTLYQFEISPFCDKVRRALTYKGIEFRVHEMLFSQQQASLEISPTHKFPVIEVDGERVVDSTDIAYYLERRFPRPPLIPDDPVQRAQMHIIEDWADESLFPYDLAMRFLWEHNVPLVIEDIFKYETPEFQKLMAETVPPQVREQLIRQGLGRKDRDAILRDVRRHVQAVDALVSRGHWLVGDALSYGDIAVRAMFYVIGRAAEGAEMLGERPAILDWQARVDGLTLPKEPVPAGRP
jgi:glutathione S-transferase